MDAPNSLVYLLHSRSAKLPIFSSANSSILTEDSAAFQPLSRSVLRCECGYNRVRRIGVSITVYWAQRVIRALDSTTGRVPPIALAFLAGVHVFPLDRVTRVLQIADLHFDYFRSSFDVKRRVSNA